jgi:hypothetical protein
VHPCVLGSFYRSEATLNGLSQDVGPFMTCLR